MAKQLKVYSACLDGRHSFIVATYTKKHAAELFGVSMHYFNGYASETGNKVELAITLAKPFTVFKAKNDFRFNYEEVID